MVMNTTSFSKSFWLSGNRALFHHIPKPIVDMGLIVRGNILAIIITRCSRVVTFDDYHWFFIWGKKRNNFARLEHANALLTPGIGDMLERMLTDNKAKTLVIIRNLAP